jgi:hypothetical protein
MKKGKQTKITHCKGCGSPLEKDELVICTLCAHLGPDVPCSLSPEQLLEMYGPIEGVPLGQVIDLNEFRAARGLPVYRGPGVDTPHLDLDAITKDIHGNPLW